MVYRGQGRRLVGQADPFLVLVLVGLFVRVIRRLLVDAAGPVGFLQQRVDGADVLLDLSPAVLAYLEPGSAWNRRRLP